jgi:hypothetical protein
MARDGYDRFDNDDRDEPRRAAKSGGGMTLPITLGIIAVVLLAVCGGGIFLIVRGVQRAAEGIGAGMAQIGETATASANAEQLAEALQEYEKANGRFPPPYLKTKDGKPGLSWRVAILPYLDEKDSFKKFKLDEPWDSPNNKPLLENMPECFSGPKSAREHSTHFRVFVGRRTMFDPARNGVRIADVTDGLANTIMIVEAEQAVPWTKPEELDYDANRPLPALRRTMLGSLIIAADGEVHYLQPSNSEATIRALITIDDGVPVQPAW